MLPIPATIFWSSNKGFIWALREVRVSRRYSTPFASNSSSRGSGPRAESRASSSSSFSSRARLNRVSSRRKSLRSSLRWSTSMSAVRGSSTGGTRRSWPPIFSWKTSESPVSRSTIKCFARRRAPEIRPPSNPSSNFSVEGCSTRAGSKTSTSMMSEPTTSSRRSSFIVSTSGSSGIRVFIPLPQPLVPAATSRRFAGDERRVSPGQRVPTVTAHSSNLEAHSTQLPRYLRRFVQTLTVYFVVPSVVLPHLPEAGDPAGQRTPLRVLLLLDEHNPVLSFGESPGRGSRWDLSRLRDVEDEDAIGSQRIVYTAKETNQPPSTVVR